MHRTGLLPDVDRSRRKSIVRAVYRGSAVEEREDAVLALEAIDRLRQNELRRPIVRWLPWIAGPILVGLLTLELLGRTSPLDLAGLALTGLMFATVWWWHRSVLPRRLDDAETANRALLSEQHLEDRASGREQ